MTNHELRSQIIHALNGPLAVSCETCHAEREEPCRGLTGMVHTWRGDGEVRIDLVMEIIDANRPC